MSSLSFSSGKFLNSFNLYCGIQAALSATQFHFSVNMRSSFLLAENRGQRKTINKLEMPT
jgi:hypothetical protein